MDSKRFLTGPVMLLVSLLLLVLYLYGYAEQISENSRSTSVYAGYGESAKR